MYSRPIERVMNCHVFHYHFLWLSLKIGSSEYILLLKFRALLEFLLECFAQNITLIHRRITTGSGRKETCSCLSIEGFSLFQVTEKKFWAKSRKLCLASVKAELLDQISLKADNRWMIFYAFIRVCLCSIAKSGSQMNKITTEYFNWTEKCNNLKAELAWNFPRHLGPF